MTIEYTNQQEQVNETPLDIEKIEARNIPVEVNNGKLIINGVKDESFSQIDHLKIQKNNPDLVQFRGSKGEENNENYYTRIIDINNPEQEILSIKRVDDGGSIMVNDVKWDSLTGKDIYWAGYNAEVDPEGKKIVFSSNSNDEKKVIVNNQMWNTKFHSLSIATSRFGTPYAVGDGKLIINDQEWIFPKWTPTEASRYYRGNYAGSIDDKVKTAVIGKNGQVAAAVTSLRTENGREHILIGDKTGAKQEWEHTLQFSNNLIIDDETGQVAVFGYDNYDSQKMGLIINDIPYALEGNPKNLEIFKFENGALVVQYVDAIGEKITEKISLKENSRELQEAKEKENSIEQAMVELRKLLAQENISPAEILARLKKGEKLEKDLEVEQNRNKTLVDNRRLVEQENLKLKMEKDQANKDNAELLRVEKMKVTQTASTLTELEGILNKAEKSTFGGYKVDIEGLKQKVQFGKSIVKSLDNN